MITSCEEIVKALNKSDIERFTILTLIQRFHTKQEKNITQPDTKKNVF